MSRLGSWRTVVPAAVTAAVTLFVVLGRAGEWWGQWRPTVDWWATAALLVFPVAALTGALRGVASRRNGRALLAATSSRSALVTTSRDLVDGIWPVLAGYLVVLAGVLIATGTLGPWGWPPLLECVAYLVAVAAVGALGYAAGSLLPYPAVPAVAAVSALVIPFGLTYSSAWENLMPPVSSYGPFYYPPNSFLLTQLSFFAAVGAVGVLAASRRRVFTTTAVVGVLVIGFMLAPLRGTSVARQDLQASTPQCRQLARVHICVARAQANQLDRLVTLVDRLGPLLAALYPAGVTLAASGVDLSRVGPGRGPALAINLRSGNNVQAARYDSQDTANDLVPVVLGIPLSCPMDVEDQSGTLVTTLGVEIAKWAAISYGIKPIRGNVQFASLLGAADSDVADRLVALPIADVISWIASPQVRAGIRTCAPASRTELPT